MKVSIRHAKSRFKFCAKMNKVFGCRDVYMCNVSCPLHLWAETITLMDLKNLSLGEAFRLSIRQSIERDEGRKIIKDAVLNKNKPYPDPNWRKKFES